MKNVSRLLLAVTLSVLLVSQASAQKSASQTIQDTMPKMVKIYGAGGIRGLHGYSSGFLITPQGHIATVWNHVLDAETVTVVLADGRRFDAKLVNAEPQLDLAVLKLQTENDGQTFPYFDYKNSGSAGAGTRVLGFSNMFKVATGNEPVSVLHGVIAAKTKLSARRGVFEIPYDGTVYVVDAITNNPGSGGGALMTRDGKLLGMIGREVRNTQTNTWMNYAIPMSEMKDTIDQILSGKFIAKKKSDIDDNPNRYASVDFGFVMVPDVVFRTPAYIDSVVSDSSAAKVGLQPDDLVLFVNDELIQSNRMLALELGRLQSGDTVRLVVRRGPKLVTVTLIAPKKPDATAKQP